MEALSNAEPVYNLRQTTHILDQYRSQDFRYQDLRQEDLNRVMRSNIKDVAEKSAEKVYE